MPRVLPAIIQDIQDGKPRSHRPGHPEYHQEPPGLSSRPCAPCRRPLACGPTAGLALPLFPALVIPIASAVFTPRGLSGPAPALNARGSARAAGAIRCRPDARRGPHRALACRRRRRGRHQDAPSATPPPQCAAQAPVRLYALRLAAAAARSRGSRSSGTATAVLDAGATPRAPCARTCRVCVVYEEVAPWTAPYRGASHRSAPGGGESERGFESSSVSDWDCHLSRSRVSRIGGRCPERPAAPAHERQTMIPQRFEAWCS